MSDPGIEYLPHALFITAGLYYLGQNAPVPVFLASAFRFASGLSGIATLLFVVRLITGWW